VPLNGKYILDGHEAVLCDNIYKWAEWYEKADRRVANDMKQDIQVSTVFLGLDSSFGRGLPILFETMVFGGEYDERSERYSTWEEAEQGHKRMCELVFGEWGNIARLNEEVLK
jgi:hypothetical protein